MSSTISKDFYVNREKGETYIANLRVVSVSITNICKFLDEILGFGAETIVHYAWFNYGRNLFNKILERYNTKHEALEFLLTVHKLMGLGIPNLKIKNQTTPIIIVEIKNPPIKSLEGSAKRIIASFWAGILSEYYEKILTCIHFKYDERINTFSFLVCPTLI